MSNLLLNATVSPSPFTEADPFGIARPGHLPGCDCTECDFVRSELAAEDDLYPCCGQPQGYCTCDLPETDRPMAEEQAEHVWAWLFQLPEADFLPALRRGVHDFTQLASDRPIPGHGLAHDLDDSIPF